MNDHLRSILTPIILIAAALFAWRMLLYPLTDIWQDTLDLENGRLNAAEWDFSEQGLLELGGEWLFFHQLLLSPEQLNEVARTGDSGEYLRIPGFWNWQNEEYPAKSYGTYVAQIELPEDMRQFGIYIEEVHTSYKLFINGREVLSQGRVSSSASTSQSEILPQMWFTKLDTNKLSIILQVANFQAIKGGLRLAPVIGRQEQIIQRYFHESAADLFLFGSILIMAIYHLGLYFFHRQDRRALCFALFCAMIALRGGLTGSRFLHWLFEDASFQLLTRMEFLSAFGAAFFYYHYHKLRFPDETWKPFTHINNIVIGFLSIAAVLMPIVFIAQVVVLFEVFVLIEIVLILGGLAVAVYRRRPESHIFTAGFTILFITVINDLSHYNMIAGSTYLLHYGLFIFILLHSLLLAYRFSKIERSSLNYAATLEALNQKLEKQVRDHKPLYIDPENRTNYDSDEEGEEGNP